MSALAFVALLVLIVFNRRLPAALRVVLTIILAIRWPLRTLLLALIFGRRW